MCKFNYLIEIEHKIQFTHIMEVLIEDFYKVVYSLQVAEIVVIDVYTDAKIETSIPSIYNLEVAKLKIRNIVSKIL